MHCHGDVTVGVTRFRIGTQHGNVTSKIVTVLLQSLGRKQFHIETLVVTQHSHSANGNGRGLLSTW